MDKSTIKDYLETKAAEIRAKADIQCWRAKQWMKEHPEQTATIVATAVGAIGIILKGTIRGVRLHKEQVLKDRYIYDRSLGAYWLLRRKPTTSEKLAIETMRKQGLGYGDILTRLKLL